MFDLSLVLALNLCGFFFFVSFEILKIQDGVIRSMEDEMSSITFDMLCRNP